MKWLMPKHLVAAGLLSAAAASVSSGCADNDSMLFVSHVLAITAPDCVAEADASALALGSGVLDLAFRDTYEAAILIGNQVTQRGSRDQLRTETSRITLRGAIVEVMDAQGGLITEYTTNGTGFVHPADGTDPGFGVMFTQLLPPDTVEPGRTVNVGVRVFGDTLGGQEIESSQLTFPIFVCFGCLVNYPAEARDPQQPPDVYRCLATGEDRVALPCRFGQDEIIDCRACAGAPICNDPAQNPSL